MIFHNTKACISLLLILIGYFSFAQSNNQIRFSTISTDDGLSNNSINAIIKDDLGFIWVGTNDGLCRYESSGHVKIYRNNFPNIVGGLESSNIRSLYFDSRQNLWIGTRLGGLTRYHQASNTWQTYRHDKNNPNSISNDEILKITEDSKGRLWIGTEDGLNVYNYDTDSFFTFQVDTDNKYALKAKAILSIIEDDKGWIWVGTWAGGLHLAVPKENQKIKDLKFRNFVPSNIDGAANIWALYQDYQGHYWIGSRGAGVFLMQLPSNSADQVMQEDWKPTFYGYQYDKKNNHSIANNHIQQIYEDSQNNLWIATVNGLNQLKKGTWDNTHKTQSLTERPVLHFDTYSYDSKTGTSITNKDVSTIFEDDQGIIWFGTYSGISQYNPFTNQFEVHNFFEDISKIPNAQNLYVDQKGIAWIGNGENGLLKYDLKEKRKIKFDQHAIGFSDNYVNSLFCNDNEHLYVGTRTGVSVYNMRHKSIKHYTMPDSLTSKYNDFFIRSLVKDKQGRVWIGTEQGLFLFLEEDRRYIMLTHDPSNPFSISDNSINKIYEDSQQNIWVATFNGLNKLTNDSVDHFSFQRFKHDPEAPENSIPSNRSVALKEINGILYIGSDSGLFGYDLKKGSFTNFSLYSDKHSIQSIEKTIDGNLWASTTEGIIFFDTQTKAFNKYKKQDGLGDIIFQSGSSYLDQDGYLYFGSRKGITKFNPSNIKKNEVPPAVYVTDIRKMSPKGEQLINGPYLKEIVLEHNEYYLSLDYIGLNYNRSEKNKYAFLLEGFETKWNHPDQKGPAIYTNLKHGTYYFRVKAANNDGVWNEEGTTLKIIKKPAFWETWWFRIGVGLLTMFVIWLGFKYYNRNIIDRNRILQKYNNDLNAEINRRKKVEQELQLREQNIKKANIELQRSNKDLEQFAYIASHDLQEPLRVVGSFIGLLKRRYKQHFDEDALQYIDFAVDGVKRMSKQIESILTFSKVGKQEIVLTNANLNNIVKVKLYDLSNTIKEKNVEVRVSKMPTICCEKHQIDMVLYNLINNAIKFNKKENPLVIVNHDNIDSDEFWQFSVKDNGIGIDPIYKNKVFNIFSRLHSRQDFEGTGIGLALCQKIVHRHNGEIWFESEPGEGTTFYFTISKKLTDQKCPKFKAPPKEILLENLEQ